MIARAFGGQGAAGGKADFAQGGAPDDSKGPGRPGGRQGGACAGLIRPSA
ncbi:hypothetical protein ACRAWD_25305 [Caulobacter segnis]